MLWKLSLRQKNGFLIKRKPCVKLAIVRVKISGIFLDAVQIFLPQTSKEKE